MIFELSQTKIRLSFSFAAVVTLMLLLCDGSVALISLFCSLLHEAGHLALMFAFGDPPREVDLGAFGIRIERGSAERLGYRREAAIALGGVAVNFVLLIFFSAGYFYFGTKPFFVGAAVNLLIALLNLMPVGILDCGRFLRYILLMRFDSEKTETVLNFVSDFTVLLFALFCVLFTVFVGLNASLICVCIYLMLINLKRRQTND